MAMPMGPWQTAQAVAALVRPKLRSWACAEKLSTHGASKLAAAENNLVLIIQQPVQTRDNGRCNAAPVEGLTQLL
jgi:hypothetical protein